VLELKAQGMTYRGIARQLGISPRTAEAHTSLARRATNSTTLQLAVAVAVESYIKSKSE